MEDVKVSNGANRRKVRAVSFAGFRLCCVEIRNLT